MTPLVSIIVPCHNAARWLAATLDCATAQTWPQREVIVVDDGSTDDSGAIARRYADRGVQLIRQPQRGASAARNAGVAAAQGEYLQFLDADDLIAPEKIERQLAVLASSPPDQIAAGSWGVFSTEAATARFQPEPVWGDATPVDWLVRSWAGGGMFPPIVWLVPRAVATAAGPWNEELSLDDDGEYFARVLLRCSGIRFVPDARSYYRRHDGARISAARGRRAAQSSFRSTQLKEQHLRAVEDSPRVRRALGCAWQRFAWEQLVVAPELAAEALARSRTLAPDLPPPAGSPWYERLRRLTGWQIARRTQLRIARWFGR